MIATKTVAANPALLAILGALLQSTSHVMFLAKTVHTFTMAA
jgi:hypothetical protein